MKILEKFKEIENKDLVVAPDMVKENRVGQKSDTMPWFWRLGPESQSDTENAGWMEECECDYCKVWRVIDIYSWQFIRSTNYSRKPDMTDGMKSMK